MPDLGTETIIRKEKPMADLSVGLPLTTDQARTVCTLIRQGKNHRFRIRMKQAGTSKTWIQELYVIKSDGTILGPWTYDEAAFRAKVISIVNANLEDVKFG